MWVWSMFFVQLENLQDILEELQKLTSTCRQPVSQRRLCQFWPIFIGWNWNSSHSVGSGLHARSMSQFSACLLPSPPHPPKREFKYVFFGNKDNLHYVCLIELVGGRDLPHLSRATLGPTHPSVPIMGTGLLPGVKQPGRGLNHPSPFRAKVKERVELYLYSPSEPSWPVLGWTLLSIERLLCQ